MSLWRAALAANEPGILQFVRGRVRPAERRGVHDSLYLRLPQTDSSPLRPFCLRFPLTPLPLLSSSFQGSVTLNNIRFLSNDYPSCNCKDPVYGGRMIRLDFFYSAAENRQIWPTSDQPQTASVNRILSFTVWVLDALFFAPPPLL